MAITAAPSILSPAHALMGDNIVETIAKGFGQQKSDDKVEEKNQKESKDSDDATGGEQGSTLESDLKSQEVSERAALTSKHINDILPPEKIGNSAVNKDLGKPSKVLKVEDFDLLKTLGTGTFARVWLARLSDPQNEDEKKGIYALKILRKVDVIKLKQVEHVRNERNTLGAVAGHPFITKLIRTFSDRECLYMLLDYCPGGELFTYLRRARRFNEPTSRFYAAEIVLILEFLHEKEGVAYRDLKPENILLDADGHIKLVDFGFAKKLGNTETYTLCGTPEYLAPEVIKNTGHGKAVDWWAFGILLYEFLIGQPPFWDPNPMKIYSKIVAGQIPFPTVPVDFARQQQRDRTPSANTGLETKRPSKRTESNAKSTHLSADDQPGKGERTRSSQRQEMALFPSPPARSLISAVCTLNPSRRLGNIAGGVQQIKDHEFFKEIDWDALYWKKMKGPIIPAYAGGLDASCFDEYDPPTSQDQQERFTDQMEQTYGDVFAEF